VLYKDKKLSLGKAAELAGYTKIEFIEELQKNKDLFLTIPKKKWMRYLKMLIGYHENCF